MVDLQRGPVPAVSARTRPRRRASRTRARCGRRRCGSSRSRPRRSSAPSSRRPASTAGRGSGRVCSRSISSVWRPRWSHRLSRSRSTSVARPRRPVPVPASPSATLQRRRDASRCPSGAASSCRWRRDTARLRQAAAQRSGQPPPQSRRRRTQEQPPGVPAGTCLRTTIARVAATCQRLGDGCPDPEQRPVIEIPARDGGSVRQCQTGERTWSSSASGSAGAVVARRLVDSGAARPPARGRRARRESRDPRSRPGPRALALRGRLGLRDGAAGARGRPPARLAARQGPRRLELPERDDLGARRARGLRHLGVSRRGRLVVGGRAAGLRAHRAARARRPRHGEPAHVVRAGRHPRVDRRGGRRSAGSR